MSYVLFPGEMHANYNKEKQQGQKDEEEDEDKEDNIDIKRIITKGKGNTISIISENDEMLNKEKLFPFNNEKLVHSDEITAIAY